MHRVLNRFALAAAFVAPLVLAQTDQLEEMTNDEPFPILTATCDDIYDLFEEATPGEGKDPKEVEEAQDDVLYFVSWAHGYLRGRDGIDQEKRRAVKRAAGSAYVAGAVANHRRERRRDHRRYDDYRERREDRRDLARAAVVIGTVGTIAKYAIDQSQQ
jgi:hypothetical protein